MKRSYHVIGKKDSRKIVEYLTNLPSEKEFM